MPYCARDQVQPGGRQFLDLVADNGKKLKWRARREREMTPRGWRPAYLPIRRATFMRCTLSAARCVQMIESRTSLSACGSMWAPSRPRTSM